MLKITTDGRKAALDMRLVMQLLSPMKKRKYARPLQIFMQRGERARASD